MPNGKTPSMLRESKMTPRLSPLWTLAKLSPLLLPLLLTGCESAGSPPPAVTVVDNSCAAFGQITWSVEDTAETSTQIRRHNRVYSELCPKK